MKVLKLIGFIALLVIIFKRPYAHSPHFTPVNHAKTIPTHVIKALPKETEKPLHGIDVSHFQGEIDFLEVEKSGVHFVYLKATEGTRFVDPTYMKHIEAIKQTQLQHGAYHFFQPSLDAKQQAEFFVKTIKQQSHLLPPMLDVEVSQGMSSDAIKAGVKVWLDYVQAELKCRPILYSYGDFWRDNLGTEFTQYKFWLAEYSKTLKKPDSLSNVNLWQYSDKGRIPGIEGKVDMDVMFKREGVCNA
ncbi:glycoside hydrolase family 25 protein [Alteromonas sp. a30]|uniref:glycoside hydrolase family 25 protein n=1 Tax=Alteromonas sp. a30 TaxID=2730917 RepID=UPI002282AEC2|nr:GH25 family lysozyme [Alteromonas sp. a30]MCY7295014.1 hypothetical protein [Alteromonas sp. a30]